MTGLLSCEDIVHRLWPFLDGALPETERAAVVAHLEGCAGCRSHHDFARAFLDAVHQAHHATHARSAPGEFSALQARVEAAIAKAEAEGDI